MVVKVAPPGFEPVRNRDVLRQARVMTALHGTPGVRVPAVLFEDAGPPPFFVMEFVAGEAYEPKWDVSEVPPAPAPVDRRARAAAVMLARLQAAVPRAIGLAAEPVLSLAAELDRWAALYATAGDELRGDEESLQRALRAGSRTRPRRVSCTATTGWATCSSTATGWPRSSIGRSGQSAIRATTSPG